MSGQCGEATVFSLASEARLQEVFTLKWQRGVTGSLYSVPHMPVARVFVQGGALVVFLTGAVLFCFTLLNFLLYLNGQLFAAGEESVH